MTNTDDGIAQLDRLGGDLCLDFVNTADWDGLTPLNDFLMDYLALVRWGCSVALVAETEALQLCGQAKAAPDRADGVFQRAIALRTALRAIFRAIAHQQTPDGRSLHCLNAELTQALPHLRLVATQDGYCWQWHTASNQLESLLWAIAWSAAQLLKDGELERIKECPGEQCGWLFIDSSRNRSRRWCAMRDCGNRAKASRHYQKHRPQPHLG